MSSTIVVGYDGEDAADRALDRAIEQARDHHAKLLVVSVAEMPLNPEGPQKFGTLDDSPALEGDDNGQSHSRYRRCDGDH